MRTSKFIDQANVATLTGNSRRLLLGVALGASLGVMGLAGCHSNPATPADGTTAASDPNAPDPTAANMAPVDNSTPNSTQVAGYQQQAQPSQQTYSNSAPAPIERRAPASSGQSYSDQSYADQNQGYDNTQDDNAEQGYNATLSDIEAPQPPPPLPEYSQPVAPDPNYIWTPGYWSYTPQGYYWVPGAWVQAPYTGALWTPGYWGGYNNGYRFHHGFWAAHIGFYGGINYGFGYVGTGYQGGYWNGNNFYYNQYANHIDENRIHNVYQRNVVINNTVINNRVVNNTTYNNVTVNNTRINNVSYNGGRGGIAVQPRPAELAVLREQRTPPMQAQVQVAKAAQANPQQFYARNQGKPAEIAAARPLAADRGIAAPPHTTAQINRAVPVQEQLRQQQQVFHPQQPQPQARPPATPAPLPNRVAPNQPQQRPVPQQNAAQPVRPGQPANRPEPTNQPNRPGVVTQPVRPSQPENRPAQVQQSHPVPQQQMRPQPQQPRQQVRPQPQSEARPQPQQQVRPQTQPVRPAQPQPQARPQPQQRPQPQARPEEHKPEPHA
jgi:hypothetical protein